MYFRYYNSWIENSDDLALTSSSQKTSNSDQKKESLSLFHPMLQNSLGIADDIEGNVPAEVDGSVDWESHNEQNNQVSDDDDDGDDEEEDDDNDVFGASFL